METTSPSASGIDIETSSRWIERYSGQPGRLPTELRQEIERLWPDDLLELYALVDLNENMELAETWWLLGRTRFAVATRASSLPPSGDRPASGFTIREFARESVTAVQETVGLSCTRVAIVGPGAVPLVLLRYSHRQRRAAGHIVFVLESQVKDAGTNALAGRLRGRGSNISADRLYADAVLAPVAESQSGKTASKTGVVLRLLGYLKPYKVQVGLGMAGAIVMTALSLAPPFLTGHLLDRVIKPTTAGQLPVEAALDMAWITIFGLAAVYVLREAAAWVRLRTMSMIGEFVACDLRNRVYAHLHRLSLSYFSSKQTGSIISRVSSDTDRIWDFIAFGVVEVTTSVLMLIGLGFVLLSLDWRLGLLVTVPIPIILGAIWWHGTRMQDLFLRAWRKWSALTDCLSDTIPGVRVVKAFNREKQEVDRFRARNAAVLGEFNRIHGAWTTFWPFLMLGLQMIVLSVWIFGVPRVIGGEGAGSLTPGTFISFVLYLTMFVHPIEIIGQMARMVNRATSSAYRVFEVLDTQPQVTDGENAKVIDEIKGSVKFESVVFSYDGVRQVLKNVSFEVKPGEMIGLVGPSGSGKTTITNVLARFYDVTEGRVLIDGVELRELDSGHYRRQVGMVLQDPYLFHGSILENIRYARPDASLGEVIAAAKAANAHEFVSKLSHGYDTTVGERGHTLSGGERQRISIARAILLNPRILILDEATSAVDTETERQIQEAMDRLVKGRTTFAIAHRLSTLTRADRLLVIKDGRLLEEGTHAELLKKEDGLYRKLFRLQQELNETNAVEG